MQQTAEEVAVYTRIKQIDSYSGMVTYLKRSTCDEMDVQCQIDRQPAGHFSSIQFRAVKVPASGFL